MNEAGTSNISHVSSHRSRCRSHVLKPLQCLHGKEDEKGPHDENNAILG